MINLFCSALVHFVSLSLPINDFGLVTSVNFVQWTKLIFKWNQLIEQTWRVKNTYHTYLVRVYTLFFLTSVCRMLFYRVPFFWMSRCHICCWWCQAEWCRRCLERLSETLFFSRWKRLHGHWHNFIKILWM